MQHNYWGRRIFGNVFAASAIKYLRFLPFLLLLWPINSLAQVSDLQVLGSFETTYRTNGEWASRAQNIRRAVTILAEAAIVISPGQTFSFNETVGRRTRRRGFLEAHVIVDGRMTDGLGGGVCQVASTLYAAAMYSGLTIVEQWPHSRTSSYIAPGLDATVDWGPKDLIVQNPYDYPIYLFIRTRPGDSSREEILTAEFRAPRREFDISIRFERTVTARFRTIYHRDATLRPGTREIVERGTVGIRVLIYRRFSPISGDGIILEEETMERYAPSSRIIRLGPPIEESHE